MKIYFLNMGNSSKSGGFSAYARFISETSLNKYIVKFSDLGTIDKNSINIFFRTVGLEKHSLFSSFLHSINKALYILVYISLLFISNFTKAKVWTQSSFLSRSKLLRFFTLKLGKKSSIIIDVRDKEFFPYIKMFSGFRFISCGQEITDKISYFTEQVFNLTTPFSSQDLKLIEIVKAGNYIVYAHGVQKDKSPERIIEFLNCINSSDYILVLCGRIRDQDNRLVSKILKHDKTRFVGNLDKLVILALIKSASGILITGKNEGIPRILEEAKNFALAVITPKKQPYLSDHEKVFTFEEFANAIPQHRFRLPTSRDRNDIEEKLERFILEG